MSAEKLSPRQQMIGIMYLVLLAMLAMNASKDLLDAFLKLESGIDLTASNFKQNVQPVYNKISEAASFNSEAAKATNQKAINIQKEAQAVFQLIETHKKWLVDNTGGVDENGIPLAKDNQDIGAEYFMVKENGKELKERMMKLKALMTGCIDKKDQAIVQSINALLATEEFKDYEDNKMSWEAGISEHLPLAAVTANLSNLQSYIRNAESITVNYLFEELGINNYKVNKIQAATIAQSSYVLKGEEYKAQIFLAASDTTQKPVILVGEYDEQLFASKGEIKWLSRVDTLDVSDGFGNYKRFENTVGEHSWKGLVRIPHPNPKRKGEFLTYPFENKFLVAQPSAVVSSDKLNIMYMGLENEISISVPGISSSKVRVSNSKCKIDKKGDGKFVFVPNSTGKTDVVVQAEINPGQWQTMGSYNWMIKKLPEPEISIGGKSLGSKINKDVIVAVGKVTATYSPDFPLTAKANVVACKLEINTSNGILQLGEVPNGVFTNAQKDRIRNLRRGENIYLIISSKGADGISYKKEGSYIIN